MSDFYSPNQRVKAVKPHRCIYCGEGILQGETYRLQTGRYDEAWFRNRYHEECWNDLLEIGEEEFCPYSEPRPKSPEK